MNDYEPSLIPRHVTRMTTSGLATAFVGDLPGQYTHITAMRWLQGRITCVHKNRRWVRPVPDDVWCLTTSFDSYTPMPPHAGTMRERLRGIVREIVR